MAPKSDCSVGGGFARSLTVTGVMTLAVRTRHVLRSASGQRLRMIGWLPQRTDGHTTERYAYIAKFIEGHTLVGCVWKRCKNSQECSGKQATKNPWYPRQLCHCGLGGDRQEQPDLRLTKTPIVIATN